MENLQVPVRTKNVPLMEVRVEVHIELKFIYRHYPVLLGIMHGKETNKKCMGKNSKAVPPFYQKEENRYRTKIRHLTLRRRFVYLSVVRVYYYLKRAF